MNKIAILLIITTITTSTAALANDIILRVEALNPKAGESVRYNFILRGTSGGAKAQDVIRFSTDERTSSESDFSFNQGYSESVQISISLVVPNSGIYYIFLKRGNEVARQTGATVTVASSGFISMTLVSLFSFFLF